MKYLKEAFKFVKGDKRLFILSVYTIISLAGAVYLTLTTAQAFGVAFALSGMMAWFPGILAGHILYKYSKQ